MRRLLIKLVAVETALVGWLAYWLFLVYANNPIVSQGLGSQLARFPQLSFTTVDISVLVIIGVLSVVVAFKFQRGLRPGIRLERALQMLENLMKRNLVLEAQVAELKLEKAHVITPASTATVQAPNEPRLGSWERAFRTPIEAGPPVPASHVPSPLARQPPSPSIEAPVEFEVPVVRSPVPRGEPKQVQSGPVPRLTAAGSNKPQDKPSGASDQRREKPPASQTSSGSSASTWEDSPKRIGETTGILTPSQSRKVAGVVPEVTSQQPYIPSPAPSSPPPGVIVGPGFSPPSITKPFARLPVGQPSPKTPVGTGQPPSQGGIKPPAPVTPVVSGPIKPSTPEPKLADQSRPKGTAAETSKPPSKPEPAKKRFPYED